MQVSRLGATRRLRGLPARLAQSRATNEWSARICLLQKSGFDKTTNTGRRASVQDKFAVGEIQFPALTSLSLGRRCPEPEACQRRDRRDSAIVFGLLIFLGTAQLDL